MSSRQVLSQRTKKEKNLYGAFLKKSIFYLSLDSSSFHYLDKVKLAYVGLFHGKKSSDKANICNIYKVNKIWKILGPTASF